jgi:hypothetical protein
LESLDEVKAAIERLNREDRAKLRPWVLAVFDVEGKFSRALPRQALPRRGLPQYAQI